MRRGALYSGERCILPTVWVATTAWERMRGLLARPMLNTDEGLLIEKCSLVHTIGMSYSLDLVFLDANWKIRKMVPGLRPLRMAGAVGAVRTLEAAAGALAVKKLRRGDRLSWRQA